MSHTLLSCRLAPCLAILFCARRGGSPIWAHFRKGYPTWEPFGRGVPKLGAFFGRGTQPGNIFEGGYPTWEHFGRGVPKLDAFSKRVPEWEAPKVGKKPKLGAPRKRVPNPGAFLQKGTQAGCVFAKGTRAEIEFHERVQYLAREGPRFAPQDLGVQM